MYHQPQGRVFPANERVSVSTTVPCQPLMQSLDGSWGTPLLVGTQACSWLFWSKCNMVGTCSPAGSTGGTRDLGFSSGFDFLKIILDKAT